MLREDDATLLTSSAHLVGRDDARICFNVMFAWWLVAGLSPPFDQSASVISFYFGVPGICDFSFICIVSQYVVSKRLSKPHAGNLDEGARTIANEGRVRSELDVGGDAINRFSYVHFQNFTDRCCPNIS